MTTTPPELESVPDVAVIGAGPAGRWIATQLAIREVSVALIDPNIDDPWPNTYGLWLDEVENLVPAVPCRRAFPSPALYLSDEVRHIDRTYALIDNDAFQDQLDHRLQRAGVEFAKTAVRSLTQGARNWTLCLGNHDTLDARLVIDASGQKAGLLQRTTATAPAFQRAYGIEAHFDGDPLQGHAMLLMDYRQIPNATSLNAPTFLYGMHLGQDRYFVEETVLVGPESIAYDELEDRLHRRLHNRGATPRSIEVRETCHIPMGEDLPQMGQPIIGFGASAGFVHPATGYQMARMLRSGPELADTIAAGIAAGHSSDAISRRGWQTIWPPERRRARKLLVFGRNALLNFNHREICRFFDTFFSLPDRCWQAYMSGWAGHRELTRIMWRFFASADMPLRLSLAALAVGDGRRVVGALQPFRSPGDPRG